MTVLFSRLAPLLLLLLVTAGGLLCCAPSANALSLQITDFDPSRTTQLGSSERFYIRLAYQSEVPVRFQPEAYLKGTRLEVGAVAKSPVLQVPGEGEAVTWIVFSNVTHMDEIRVTALDTQWQPLATVSRQVEMRWHGQWVDPPREAAKWVDPILRKEHFKQEYVYDPSPIKGGDVYDLLFFISVASLPAYLVIQTQMLRRYRKRWRELAAIPLVSLVPLALASLVGLEMQLRHWIILVFRGVPFALAYLLLLWAIKRIRYREPDDANVVDGTDI